MTGRVFSRAEDVPAALSWQHLDRFAGATSAGRFDRRAVGADKRDTPVACGDRDRYVHL